MQRELLEKYVSIVPSAVQKSIQEMGFYSFIHFGMNTFTGLEWGNGKTDASIFNPTALDCNQWCETLKEAGATGVILTAKHHDGFCLWQTKTTEYCVRNSPWKSGKGDVVAELREACDKSGLKLGLYLSPWDRNSEYYATPKYNDFYIEQLTELLTNYGELFTIWLDGACGSHMDGKPVQEYDFDRYFALIHKLQPNCAISNCGPDVRWVGNEGGFCRESEYNVIPAFNVSAQKTIEESQKDASGVVRNPLNCMTEDLGSREILAKYNDFVWYPAEVDVSIRPGWFFHKVENKLIRSIDNLLNIYYTSTGGNAMLLLNVPPNREGLFHGNDVARLKELGARIKSAFVKEVAYEVVEISELTLGKIEDINQSTISMKEAETYTIAVNFKSAAIDKVMLQEDIAFSQRIEEYLITTKINDKEVCLYEGTTIGAKKIALFKKPIVTDNLTLTILSCRLQPYIRTFRIFETDFNLPKQPKFFKLKKALRDFGTRQWEKSQERKKAKAAKNVAAK